MDPIAMLTFQSQMQNQGDFHANAAKLFQEYGKALQEQLRIVNGLQQVFGSMAKGNPANPLMPNVGNVFAPFDSSVGIAGMPTATDGRKKRKKHRPKDPDQPKRPKTAYLCFVTENMERLREETGKPQKEIMRMLGENWKSLTPEERMPFQSQADESKGDWERESSEYKKKKDAEKAANPNGTYLGIAGVPGMPAMGMGIPGVGMPSAAAAAAAAAAASSSSASSSAKGKADEEEDDEEEDEEEEEEVPPAKKAKKAKAAI